MYQWKTVGNESQCFLGDVNVAIVKTRESGAVQALVILPGLANNLFDADSVKEGQLRAEQLMDLWLFRAGLREDS